MKQVLLSFFILAFVFIGKAQTTVNATPDSKADVLQLKEITHDFGKIPQGRPVTCVFEIVNTGTEPLRLENVQASCGCTTPEWTKDAIAPGATSQIKVGYNAHAEGRFVKNVTVFYGDKKNKVITISGEVYKTATASAPENSSIQTLKQTN
ncbi:MAG TPA: DUF1573 domain-containing protein [Puia sp.]|jgi:hypothetical protein|nr:DUF1573 domain-containing protein [Puia sp.]